MKPQLKIDLGNGEYLVKYSKNFYYENDEGEKIKLKEMNAIFQVLGRFGYDEGMRLLKEAGVEISNDQLHHFMLGILGM